MTTNPVLMIDTSLLRLCQQMQYSPNTPSSIGSWKPKDSIMFTLIKTKTDTLAYCHLDDTLYCTPPMLKIDSRCPEQTAFIGNFIIEDDSPRFLVFDIIDYHLSAAIRRYQRLRELAVFLPLPICVLQWVGDLSYISNDFIARLPHPVDYTFIMSDANPLHIHRKLKLKIPITTHDKALAVVENSPAPPGPGCILQAQL